MNNKFENLPQNVINKYENENGKIESDNKSKIIINNILPIVMSNYLSDNSKFNVFTTEQYILINEYSLKCILDKKYLDLSNFIFNIIKENYELIWKYFRLEYKLKQPLLINKPISFILFKRKHEIQNQFIFDYICKKYLEC